MSATSGCVFEMPCAGFSNWKIVPVTASMIAADTSSSIRE